jgi:hypothetical protein
VRGTFSYLNALRRLTNEKIGKQIKGKCARKKRKRKENRIR